MCTSRVGNPVRYAGVRGTSEWIPETYHIVDLSASVTFMSPGDKVSRHSLSFSQIDICT